VQVLEKVLSELASADSGPEIFGFGFTGFRDFGFGFNRVY